MAAARLNFGADDVVGRKLLRHIEKLFSKSGKLSKRATFQNAKRI
ncbi:hypothetical protein RM553_09720 [Zunongwangia sp. F363]|uniref:Uncharacterized protein n=1 Tax=Autumnicola tepida TaxID=3075595 RepID=A0ABU3C9U1_9FLAO|nr:hypothetical protein [Zunongwangia sp. F363]MDT0643104.1 hypothetical protein [Zunongwangia sp. F363]